MTKGSKQLSWYTALFYFAEHIRIVTNGTVTHKMLYAQLGKRGDFINHENPRIRKSTAAGLSRLVHGTRYVDDFKETYAANGSLFDEASRWLYGILLEASGKTPSELVSFMANDVWRDVLRGLRNERAECGRRVDVARAADEMSLLLSWSKLGCLSDEDRFALVTSSILRVMVLGCLDRAEMHDLAEETVLDDDLPLSADDVPHRYACLVRSPVDRPERVTGVWLLDSAKRYTIGRYVDCEVFDPDPRVSREHCELAFENGSWSVRNLSRTQGLRIEPSPETGAGGAEVPRGESLEFEFGQVIELSGVSRYRLCDTDGNRVQQSLYTSSTLDRVGV